MAYTWQWHPGYVPAERRERHSTWHRARLVLEAKAAFLEESLSERRGSLRRRRAGAALLEGVERFGGRALRTLYVGHGHNLAYVENTLFATRPRRTELGEGSAWSAAKLLKRHGHAAELSVLDVAWPYSLLTARRDVFEMPLWVNQSRPIASTWSETAETLRGEAKGTVLRRVRKARLRARITSNTEDHVAFYREIYRPHLARRFGDACVVENERTVVGACAEQGLLQVLADGQVLSAAVLYAEGSNFKMLWLGHKDGLDKQTASAAMGALYHTSLVRAYEAGFERFDYCGSRALLSDGVLRHKEKWGASLQPSPDPSSLYLHIERVTPGVTGLLSNAPFLTPRRSGYGALFFHAGEPLERETMAAAIDEHSIAGVAGYEFASFQGFSPGARAFARERTDITLREPLRADRTDPAARV